MEPGSPVPRTTRQEYRQTVQTEGNAAVKDIPRHTTLFVEAPDVIDTMRVSGCGIGWVCGWVSGWVGREVGGGW